MVNRRDLPIIRNPGASTITIELVTPGRKEGGTWAHTIKLPPRSELDLYAAYQTGKQLRAARKLRERG